MRYLHSSVVPVPRTGRSSRGSELSSHPSAAAQFRHRPPPLPAAPMSPVSMIPSLLDSMVWQCDDASRDARSFMEAFSGIT